MKEVAGSLDGKAKSKSGTSSGAAASDGAQERCGEYRWVKYHHLFPSEFLRPYVPNCRLLTFFIL